jgi:uncharacterized protein YbaR (Trm112 family)
MAISQDLLNILRCPMDRRSRLIAEGDHLRCERCALVFPVQDGFAKMIVEEAGLPAGCSTLEQLPCQQERASSPPIS